MAKKKIILIALLFVSVLSFGQSGSFTLTSGVDPLSVTRYSIGTAERIYPSVKEEKKALLTEDEYDTANYFAAYLAIQTSNLTKGQAKLIKEMTKLVHKENGVLYTVVQSGVPPRPCGGPGQPPCQ